MSRSRPFSLAAALTLLAGCPAQNAGAQTLYIDPPRTHVSTRPFTPGEILTLDLVVDGGIRTAVSWGTDLTIADTGTLQFVPDYGGTNRPFKSLQPFFNTDLSAPYTAGSAMLNLDFLNFTPGATLGLDGPVTLGKFQVKVLKEPGFPPGDAPPNGPDFWNNAVIALDSLEIPPFGSAVQDADGNNLLTAEFGTTITSRPPSPEPAGWLAMTCGIGSGLMLLRRRHTRKPARLRLQSLPNEFC
jgi:hypothetical protein